MWTKVPPSVVGFATSLTLIAGLGLASTSHAGPCAGLPNPVVVAGAASAEPLINPIAKLLQRSDSKPMTVIWQLTTSCAGVEALALDTQTTACATGACIRGSAQFWTLDSHDTAPQTCDLDASGTKVDLAVSDVYPTTCATFSGGDPIGIMHTAGPITPYALTMSKQSSEAAIQAEEAHFIYRMGKAAGVHPWLNDATRLLLGDRDSGQLIVGARIDVKTGQWQGKMELSPSDIFLDLQSEPATAIAILPTTLTDSRRSEVHSLAFQAIGQHGAFYPDRKSTTFEKQNVRDGHYPLWGYLHMVLRTDPLSPTQPKSANGSRLADILTAKSQVATQDVLPMQVAAGLVPQCAMHVARANDSGPITLIPPQDATDSCHCWFEKNVPSGVLGCMDCSGGATCAIGTCRRNFCEGQ